MLVSSRVRKPGKLPAATAKFEYALEYGTNTLEIHKDAIQKGQRVLIVDDLLATGGTAEATARLAHSLGAEIAGLGFVVELDFLNGRDKLKELRCVFVAALRGVGTVSICTCSAIAGLLNVGSVRTNPAPFGR